VEDEQRGRDGRRYRTESKHEGNGCCDEIVRAALRRGKLLLSSRLDRDKLQGCKLLCTACRSASRLDTISSPSLLATRLRQCILLAAHIHQRTTPFKFIETYRQGSRFEIAARSSVPTCLISTVGVERKTSNTAFVRAQQVQRSLLADPSTANPHCIPNISRPRRGDNGLVALRASGQNQSYTPGSYRKR
jgi:hypothetical protein